MLTPEQKRIVEENIQLAYAFVGRAKRIGRTLYAARMDDDDMLSIAFHALCIAAKVFDISLGYTFSTLYYVVCANEFKKIIRRAVGKKCGPYFTSMSLSDLKMGTDGITFEETIADESAGTENIFQATEEVEVLRLAIEALDETLRRTVQMYYFDGLGQKEIASLYGVRQSCVSRRLVRAHKKIAVYMAMNGYCA